MSCPLTIFCAAMGQAVRRAIPLVKPDGFEGGRAKDCSITMGRPNRGRKKNIRTERERERGRRRKTRKWLSLRQDWNDQWSSAAVGHEGRKEGKGKRQARWEGEQEFSNWTASHKLKLAADTYWEEEGRGARDQFQYRVTIQDWTLQM